MVLTALAKELRLSTMELLGTCFPGMPVTRNRYRPGPAAPPISNIADSKESSADTLVNESASLFVRCDRAWGVVTIGRSRRREASTFWSKWSLLHIKFAHDI